ncbi:extracellular solute-binding protein [Streptomyces sp. NPDC004647]|uniref:extracellular solute-binding protein n=1 Tax=Streptomyces sp. NPDC004647 TaxID=3154671 RepID=UPI0033ABE513
MKRKLIAAVGVVAMVAGVAACGSDGGGNANKDPKERTGDLKVWLMVDAQTAWPELVEDVNAEFRKKYPKVKVKVDFQQWPNKVQKLDAALTGKGAPDVVELGNTETMQYILGGALAEIDAEQYENSDTWIKGLKDTCTSDGKLYCVPYYAGARVGIYNEDMFKGAGVQAAPETEDALTAALDRIEKKYGSEKAFSSLYMPGRYWYAAMSYVKAYGGSIATEDGGKWRASLSSPESIKGIEHWAELVEKYYGGDKTKDEADQSAVMSQKKSAVMYGNGWEAGVVFDKKAGDPKLEGKIKNFAFPGPGGKTLPSFIGGSDLAITQRSENQDLAAAWIKEFTSEKSQSVLVGKNTLPNNTKQLEPLKNKPETAASANAVEGAWFTPIAPGWASIEKKQILQKMLVDIVTGKKSVKEAAKAADTEIDSIINTG